MITLPSRDRRRTTLNDFLAVRVVHDREIFASDCFLAPTGSRRAGGLVQAAPTCDCCRHSAVNS